MRIIGGKARGTKLYTLEGLDTRPTLDRVKESLFNILQPNIRNCNFLDIFAGSGAIGLEAASRGAKKVIMCDKSKEAIKIIKKNIEKTHFEEIVELYNLEFEELLRNKILEKQDIIYVDPPYKTDFAYKSIITILEKDLITKESIIIIETDEKEKVLEQMKELQLSITDERKYGRVHLIFLRRKNHGNVYITRNIGGFIRK